ncbi:divalent-cation tolerance protein CutA [Desulfovibrio sp. OttesenSCG-928-G11]|nr:divalent-cation tolerance protein CutA [Desulfovibrio sp. OttesenSCG-928-G11]
MDPLFVYITAPDGTSARSMARTLVAERLCACANILDGMESYYWWDGAVQNGHESIIICKCPAKAYEALEARVRQLHPYETPCITALPLCRGFAPFLQWIADQTRS